MAVELTVESVTARAVERKIGPAATAHWEHRVQITVETHRPDGIRLSITEEWPFGTELVQAVETMLARQVRRIEAEVVV